MGVLLLAQRPTSSTVSPSAGWDGTTSWSGRAVPTEDAGVRGSGWSHQAIGGFDEAPYRWWDDDFDVTVIAEHGDADWIDYVEFWLEGASVVVSSVTRNSRTGSIGFTCTVSPPAGTDGDAHLYARIVPVNGYERLVGPLQMVFNKGESIARTVKTVKTSGGDYTTIVAACNAASNGWIIKVDAGTWNEDATGSLVAMTRGVEIRPADGLSLGDVVISRSSRGSLRIRAHPVVFDSIEFDADMVQLIYDAPNFIYVGCDFDAGAEISAPLYSNRYGSSLDVVPLFRIVESQRHHLIDCTVNAPNTGGACLMRNTGLTASADFYNGRISNTVLSGVTTAKPGEYYSRLHDGDTLVVATASYDSMNDETTITFSADTVTDRATADADDIAWIVTGALSDTDKVTGKIQMVSLTNATNTLVVEGDYSGLSASDEIFCGRALHADAWQVFGNDVENTIAQRYFVYARDYLLQPILIQDDGYTATGVAFQLCIFDAEDVGQQSQLQYTLYNFVMRQCTHVDPIFTIRKDLSPDFDSLVFDGCMFTQVIDAATQAGTWRNCHFVENTLPATVSDSTGPASAAIDSSTYVPQAGSPLLDRIDGPRLTHDYNGTALPSVGAPVGAVAG